MPHFEAARLPRPDQVPHAPLRQVQLGDAEPVFGCGECPEPRRRAVAGHENAVACLRTPANPPPQLVQLRQTEPFGVLQDRKSTRLNSSHSQSSYAVFCLKKKIFLNTRNSTK